MRDAVFTVTGVGVSAPYIVDKYLLANISIGVRYAGPGTDPTSSVTYTVEHTYNDLLAINPTTGQAVTTPAQATWYPNTGLSPITGATGAALKQDSNYIAAPSAVRLNVATAPAAAQITMTVTQSGGGGRT